MGDKPDHNNQEAGEAAAVREDLSIARTALADAQQQLQKSEAALLALLKGSVDGICLLEGRTVYFANPRLCEMMQCSAEELVGEDFTQFLVSEELERTLRLYKRMVHSAAFPQRYETVLHTPTGTRMEVGVSADKVEFQGRASIMITVRDISAHQRARQMAVENERLEAVLTVAQGVGNNFANALGIIRSQAGTISDSFLPNTRPHSASQKILDAAEHAAELVKRLLRVVRISGNSENVHMEDLPVAASLLKARDLLAGGLQERGIRLQLSQDPRPWFVRADAGQLLDVLMNIFLNGADAMPQGGTIQVEIGQREVEQEEEADGVPEDVRGFVEVTVTDTGMGMTPDQIAHAFEPFYTTKRDQHALGLGLPVAQQMVKGWGGWIEIAGQPEAGTTVTLLIPRAPIPHESELESLNQEDRTLLVVDDHPAHRRMIVDALVEDGFVVLQAVNGDEALALYKKHASKIALTVLDWILPGLDGSSVLYAIQEYDPDARVLLVSGFAKDYVRSQIQRGAWAFLQKPFSAEALCTMVRETLPAPRCLLPADGAVAQTEAHNG